MSARGGTKKDLLHVIRGMQAKLRAAEEMGKALKSLHEFEGRYVPDGYGDQDDADNIFIATIDALSVWEQAGKE